MPKRAASLEKRGKRHLEDKSLPGVSDYLHTEKRADNETEPTTGWTEKLKIL
jgi:hypothetical protein